MAFSFGFSGDDIDGAAVDDQVDAPTKPLQAKASAFPVAGQAQLPPVEHDVQDLLKTLPSKIAYNTLSIDLDGHGTILLPRRELWDVRLQLMAEDSEAASSSTGPESGELQPGIGNHDVKTGIYEGGFKSWESSVDLVKVLAAQNAVGNLANGPAKMIELGCGTALPTLVLLHWIMTLHRQRAQAVSFVLADYNPTVLQLVTTPNLLLTWALQQREQDELLRQALATDGELEITTELATAFVAYLHQTGISLRFISGAWSEELVQILYDDPSMTTGAGTTLVLGAETIYSPLAMNAFSATLLSIFARDEGAVALVGAKKHYFGVGGSLDDFVNKMREQDIAVLEVRQENEGVRRGVVKCSLP